MVSDWSMLYFILCRFLCDTKLGHAATAYHISRQEGKIQNSSSVLGLIHHLLKANVNKITDADSAYANRDLQAAFVSLAAEDVSSALVSIYWSLIGLDTGFLLVNITNTVFSLVRLTPVLSTDQLSESPGCCYWRGQILTTGWRMSR